MRHQLPAVQHQLKQYLRTILRSLHLVSILHMLHHLREEENYWCVIDFKSVLIELFHKAVSTESCSVLIKKSSCNNIISKLPRHWRGPGRVALPGSPSPRGPLRNSKHQIGRWIYHPGNKCIQLPYLCCTERANKTNRSRHRGSKYHDTLKHQWLLHYCTNDGSIVLCNTYFDNH